MGSLAIAHTGDAEQSSLETIKKSFDVAVATAVAAGTKASAGLYVGARE